MDEVTALYDDLVSIHKAALVLQNDLSNESRAAMQKALERIERKLQAALSALSDEECHDIMIKLDRDYGGGAWRELDALL